MVSSRWQLNNTTGGLWDTGTNWTAGVPNAIADQATFNITDAALSGGGAGTRTIDLGGNLRTVGLLDLVGDTTRGWNISNGILSLESGFGTGSVNFTSGNAGQSQISATVDLDLNSKFTVSSTGIVAGLPTLKLGNITEFFTGSTLEKLGNGVLTLTGSAGYTGTTTISGGKLQVGDQTTTGSLGTGAVINNATLVFARSDNITVANQITGSGDIAIAGLNASVTLSGSNTINNFVVVQNNATLKLGNVHALDGTGSLFVEAGSTFDFNGITPTGAELFTGTFFNRIFPTATGTITNSDPNTQVFLFDTNASNDSFAGSLQGNIDFLHSGSGTLTLTGNSTLSGFQVQGGTVRLSGANAQINASTDIQGGTFDISGSGLSTVTVRDLSGNASGHVVLGGKTLQVSDALFFGDPGNAANAPGITGTIGLTDTLRVNMEAGRTTALDASTLVLTNWTDNVDKVVLTGNALANTITGTAFGDEINGGLGNDTTFAGGGNDTMFDGGDLLGNDTYDGGTGSDSVRYDLATKAVNVSLAITTAQNTVGAGKDTLIGIENLTGSAFNDTLTGNAGSNNLFGFNGNDKLIGGAGNDFLFGGNGNDSLNGGLDADTMAGEAGNDAYTVDNVGDVVSEALGQGTDMVSSSISYTLTDNVENLTLTGTADINGTGNALNNVIKANAIGSTLSGLAGNDTLTGGIVGDTLIGGLGKDTLTGGGGADDFVFDKLETSANKDTVKDFTQAQGDHLVFQSSAFTGLAASAGGFLNPIQFGTGKVATTADQRLIYDATLGNLFYDADGSASGAQVLVATLTNKGALAASDIFVF